MAIWEEDIAIGEYCTEKPALVQVFDLAGNSKMKIEGHMEGITSLTIWKDMLVSGSADKKISLWKKSGKAQAFLMPGTVRHLTVIDDRLWCTTLGFIVVIQWDESEPKIDSMKTPGIFSSETSLKILGDVFVVTEMGDSIITGCELGRLTISKKEGNNKHNNNNE